MLEVDVVEVVEVVDVVDVVEVVVGTMPLSPLITQPEVFRSGSLLLKHRWTLRADYTSRFG